MDFIKFSVDTTNIFPLANTTHGGQFLSEYNLTAREGVSSAESIKYSSGPSYVHAEEDFFISALSSGEGGFFPDSTIISSSVLQIAPGRGVIDGHFVENLVSMTVDLLDVNAKLVTEGMPPLSGKLAVGLRIMYSTEQTMAGSVDASVLSDIDEGEYFEGIQVVILPESDFLLPTSKFTNADGNIVDCGLPENKGYVTAHLLLATFSFFNGNIQNVVNNYPAKCQMLPASRVGSIDRIISDDYIKRTGLNEKKIYAFAGKGKVGNSDNEELQQDTWCDVTDSLIVWDEFLDYTNDSSEIAEIEKIKQADFITVGNNVVLRLPHKQIDGESAGYDIENANGERIVFRPRDIALPIADFSMGTPGTVDKKYTNHIKEITSKIDNFYQLTNGNQVMYIEELNDRADLPPINEQWSVGDYILVGRDNTISDELNDTIGITPPASLYVVLAGCIYRIEYTKNKPKGAELGRIRDEAYSSDPSNDPELLAKKPNTDNSDIYNEYWDLKSNVYRGITGTDFFTYEFTTYVVDVDEETGTEKVVAKQLEEFYYTVAADTTSINGPVLGSGPFEYSDPIQLTGHIPFATEQMIGGFLNVPENAVDGGYVYLDDAGHLRLLDYALLRSGTLAYQLGEDFIIPAGQSIAEIQAFLDEYVNQRIAFPNLHHSQTAENPNIIDITLNLSAIDSDDESENTLNIYDIDSRFQTAVRINICGTANERVKINISDCSRIIINPEIGGNPTINLYRSCLYYNSETIDALNNIRDMSLWYAKFKDTDPTILVDGMTVKYADTTGNANHDVNTVSREYWSSENVNDFHFKVALQGITFSSSGYIIGCSVLVGNDSTTNIIREGRFVIHDTDFNLVQGPNTLRYPITRFVNAVKVTGQLIACYRDELNSLHNVQNTSFSLSTPYYKNGILQKGEIAFFVDSYVVNSIHPDNIDVWETGAYHLFEGAVI